ncbi:MULTISPECIES: hypothetical protein [unclassified Butyrivibrio]|uniref:hypothetical protein n=1 Tax=unclassified Butyrivibrio TaxID=2639466 RepID=UPI0003B2E502|nr:MULTISPECIES: hypothetical protein [unclassified Butyrivibrio]
MDQRSNSRLSLFLMELIVAIMFFSLSAAVCVRLFASAHIMAETTENLSNATIWTQNLAEAFEGKKGRLSDMADLFPDAVISYTTSDPSMSDGSLVLFFDDKWNQVNGLANSSYVANLSITTEDASRVYSDVSDYGISLIGKAAVGEITVIDIRGLDELTPEASVDPKRIIMSVSVDTYLGKEGR